MSLYKLKLYIILIIIVTFGLMKIVDCPRVPLRSKSYLFEFGVKY